MSRNKDNMTPRRWDYIKLLGTDMPPHYLHKSCEAMMLPHPAGPHLPMVPMSNSHAWMRKHQVPIKRSHVGGSTLLGTLNTKRIERRSSGITHRQQKRGGARMLGARGMV